MPHFVDYDVIKSPSLLVNAGCCFVNACPSGHKYCQREDATVYGVVAVLSEQQTLWDHLGGRGAFPQVVISPTNFNSCVAVGWDGCKCTSCLASHKRRWAGVRCSCRCARIRVSKWVQQWGLPINIEIELWRVQFWNDFVCIFIHFSSYLEFFHLRIHDVHYSWIIQLWDLFWSPSGITLVTIN